MVGHVTGGKHALDTGRRGIAGVAAGGVDIAVFHLELAIKNLRIRLVADRDEHTLQIDISGTVIFDIPDAHASHTTVVTQDFIERVVPLDGNHTFLGLLEQPVLQDFLGTQCIAAMHEGDMRGNVRKVQRLFNRRVAATDDGHGLVLEEEPVTGRAGRDPAALEGLFRIQPQVHRGGTGRDDQGITGIDAGIALESKWPLLQVGRMNVVENDFRIKALSMHTHVVHQRGALQVSRTAWPVFHFRGRHQLATLFQPGNQYGVQIGARRINCRRVSRGTGTQDQEPAVLRFTHV